MTGRDVKPPRARRGRRDGASVGVSPGKPQYRRLVNTLPRAGLFSDDEVVHIHDTALRVLENLGLRVLSEEARGLFRRAGAAVDEASLMVRIDRGLVAEALVSAPATFVMAGGSPERQITIGGDNVTFLCVGGPPHVADLDRGRRPGTVEDMKSFIKLSQYFDVLQLQSSNVEPLDVDVAFRHLHATESQLLLSDKPLFVFSRGIGQVRDIFDMIRIGRGVSEDEFVRTPWCYTVINTNSPRQLDIPMSQGLIDFARAGQVAVVTPFTLAGAMAPITIPGALALQHAEALAGITLAQIVRPGAPVVYGSFTSNVDMKSGSPAFGTPEAVQAAFGAGQLARHIGLPWRGSAATASNAVDAQATYEFLMSLWGNLLGGANMILHAAGWLESGLTASLEKFIIDVEMLQTMAEILLPVTVDEATIGYEALAEVEPGGHFFGATHTLARYQEAFYRPLVSDWRNFGQWSEAGAQTTTERANAIWKKVLADFEPPPLDPAIKEALADFVARRTREGGAPPVG